MSLPGLEKACRRFILPGRTSLPGPNRWQLPARGSTSLSRLNGPLACLNNRKFRVFRITCHSTTAAWHDEPAIRGRHPARGKRSGVPRIQNPTSCILLPYRASPTWRGGEASPVNGKITEAACKPQTEAPDATLGKLYAKECQRPRTAVPREIDPPAVRRCGPHPWMQA